MAGMTAEEIAALVERMRLQVSPVGLRDATDDLLAEAMDAMLAQQKRIAELESALRFYSGRCDADDDRAYAETLEDRERQIAELRDALRPFAEEAEEMPSEVGDDEHYYHLLGEDMIGSDITVGDCRRARVGLGGMT